MRPHRGYLHPIRKLLQAEVVRGFAHITGGGLSANLPRMLPKGLAAEVTRDAWELPPIFSHLQQLGGLSRDEMYSTFNMGVGLVCVIPSNLLQKAKQVLPRLNDRSCWDGWFEARNER